MRTTNPLHGRADLGGDVEPTTPGAAPTARRTSAIELHLGRGLRAADVAADLAAAGTRCRGTLDGTITSIQAGEHGVLVRHLAGVVA